AVRVEGPLVASATGAAELGVFGHGQARSLHRDRRESRVAGNFRSEISRAIDAGERENVRQVRRVMHRAREIYFDLLKKKNCQQASISPTNVQNQLARFR